jgi:hypothetical protein
MPKEKAAENSQKEEGSRDESQPTQTLMEKAMQIAQSLPKKEDLTAEDAPIEENNEEENVASEEPPENTAENEDAESQESEIELEAREQGWVPFKEFKGNPKNWRSAEEYVVRTPLLEQIAEQRKEIKALQRNFDTVTMIAKKQMELAMQPTFEKIKEQKTSAIESGDVAAVERYEADYNKAKQDFDKLMTETETVNNNNQANDPKDLPPEVIAFTERNKSWWNANTPENAAMSAFAIKVEENLALTQPNLSITERLVATERAIKEQFSHRFENPNRKKPQAVESKTNPVKRNHKDVGFDDLPSNLKVIVRNMLKMDRRANDKKMTADQYTKQLLESGAIKAE